MTCKEEGCNFVTDAAEDEAHLPLVMKVMLIVRMTEMMIVVVVVVMVRMKEADSTDPDAKMTITGLRAARLHSPRTSTTPRVCGASN